MADTTMTLEELLDKAEHTDDVDFLREGVRILAQHLMEAEVAEHTGAAHGERVPEQRTAQRNGYRSRRWDTRVGTVELAIPKVRRGPSYFPGSTQPSVERGLGCARRADRAS